MPQIMRKIATRRAFARIFLATELFSLISSPARAESPRGVGPGAAPLSTLAGRTESGNVAVPSTIELSLWQKPFEKVVSISREQAAFSAYGSIARIAAGIRENLEIRAEGGWITAASSGHSGQFDATIGVKRRMFSASSLAASVLTTVGAEKTMGYRPWYSTTMKFPVSTSSGPILASIAPMVARGLHQDAPLAPGAEAAAALEITSGLSLYGEVLYWSRRPNLRFSSFFSPHGEGAVFSAGLLARPHSAIQVPLTLVFKARSGQTVYGLAGFGAQGSIAL